MHPERADSGGQAQLAETFERFMAQAEAEAGDLSLRDWVDLAEAWRIERALRETRGNRSAAARKLGIGRRTLYAKMHKLGL
jgi:DNA-binding NtrC family response regulator